MALSTPPSAEGLAQLGRDVAYEGGDFYMSLLDAAALLLTLAALFGLFNHHLLKLPFTIGMMVSGLLASLCVLGLDALVPSWALAETVRSFIVQIDFAETVLRGMLTLLLFAGS